MTSPNYSPEDARDQLEDGDEMHWKSINFEGTAKGHVVLQQLVVLRDGNVLPLDAHRTIRVSV